MFLSHQTILKYIKLKKIIVGPTFDEKNIRPAGIRLHLAKEILVPESNQIVNLTESTELKYKEFDISKEDFFIKPGQFILGASYETIKTSNDLLAILDGRSTIARLGLTTHITASIIDGTFEKPHACTFEIKNVGPFKIKLKYKDPIAMLLFAELTEPVTQKLQSQYTQRPDKVSPANLSFKTGKDK